jgi:excisionase family DNA binding protein
MSAEGRRRIGGVPELATYLDLPKSWVYAQAEAGALPHFKLGRYLRFDFDEIDRYLEHHRRGPDDSRAGADVRGTTRG